MLTSAGHICAVQGTCSRLLAARTHNPPVVGSSPTRPLIESASQSLVTCEYGSGSRSWLAGACAVVLGKTPVYAGGCAECVPKTKINWDWRSQVAAPGEWRGFFCGSQSRLARHRIRASAASRARLGHPGSVGCATRQHRLSRER
jgi:hypothetical protein